MLASPRPPSFLDMHRLPVLSRGCKAMCIVYLSRRTVQVFIPLMRFLLQSLVSRSFLVQLRYSFFSPFISNCLMVTVSNIPKDMWASFLRAFKCLLDLEVLCLPSFAFLLLIISVDHMLNSMLNSISMTRLYILIVYITFPILFHFCKQLDVVHYVINLLQRFSIFVVPGALSMYVTAWCHCYYK